MLKNGVSGVRTHELSPNCPTCYPLTHQPLPSLLGNLCLKTITPLAKLAGCPMQPTLPSPRPLKVGLPCPPILVRKVTSNQPHAYKVNHRCKGILDPNGKPKGMMEGNEVKGMRSKEHHRCLGNTPSKMMQGSGVAVSFLIACRPFPQCQTGPFTYIWKASNRPFHADDPPP